MPRPRYYAGPVSLDADGPWQVLATPVRGDALESLGKALGFRLLIGPHRTRRGAAYSASCRHYGPGAQAADSTTYRQAAKSA